MFIGLDKNNIVIGYSSSKNLADNEIEVKEDKLPADFEFNFTFYKYDSNTNELIFCEELKEKYIKDKEDILPENKKIENLTKQLAESKVDSMQKNMIISNLTKQRAADKIDYMKSRNIMDMLTKQQAVTKLEVMKMKGEN